MAPGKRDCAGRYEAIAKYLRDNPVNVNRELTVLDFGANNGYFSKRLAEDFGAKVTAVDSNRGALAPLRADRARTRIKTIVAELSPADIRRLGRFDVVLGLSVLHHQPRWREYLDALTKAGTVAFIETSHPAEKLPRATAQRDAQEILESVAERSTEHRAIAGTPGYDESQMRDLWVLDSRKDAAVSPRREEPQAPTEQAPADTPSEASAEPVQPAEEQPEEPTPPKRKRKSKMAEGMSDAHHETADERDD